MYYVKMESSLILILASETTLPELIASFYFLYDMKDKNKKAEELFPIVTESLADQLEKYVLYAMQQEVVSTLLYGNSNNIEILHKKIKTKIPKDIFKQLGKSTRILRKNKKNIFLIIKKNPSILKVIAEFEIFKNDSYFGKGWIKIYNLYNKLKARKNTVRTIDAIINIQHSTGNLFTKFPKIDREIDDIIKIKAGKHLERLFHFLPKGKIQQLGKKYLNNEKFTLDLKPLKYRSKYQRTHAKAYIWFQGKYIVFLGKGNLAKKRIKKLIEEGYNLTNSNIIISFDKNKTVENYVKKYKVKYITITKFLKLNKR